MYPTTGDFSLQRQRRSMEQQGDERDRRQVQSGEAGKRKNRAHAAALSADGLGWRRDSPRTRGGGARRVENSGDRWSSKAMSEIVARFRVERPAKEKTAPMPPLYPRTAWGGGGITPRTRGGGARRVEQQRRSMEQQGDERDRRQIKSGEAGKRKNRAHAAALSADGLGRRRDSPRTRGGGARRVESG